VPYRIDIDSTPPNAFELLLELGALDIEAVGDGLAAILPDEVTPDTAASALGVAGLTVSPALSRDNNSVWLLSPRAVSIGPGTLKLKDSGAFGTGYHPTTALCIEALEEIMARERIAGIVDVGAGSGILALAALNLGVPHALGLDTDAEAIKIAAENAQINGLADRLQLIQGGPGAVSGVWPLVVANVLAAPLMEMAPLLVRRVASQGVLILSGIPHSAEFEVRRAYEHLGMWHTGSKERAGWVRLTARASW
jgi:ribosomal protein L11 methyltransferase